MATMKELIAAAEAARSVKAAEHAEIGKALAELRSSIAESDSADVSAADVAKITELRAQRAALDSMIEAQTAHIDELKADQARDDAIAKLSNESVPTGAQPHRQTGGATVDDAPMYFRGSDRVGRSFFRDAFNSQRGNWQAQDRIRAHTVRTEAELLAIGNLSQQRAVATGAGGSLVVPQYLPEMFAPALRSGRPFANIVTKLAIPDQGMSITLPRLTTATTTAIQITQNSAVSNTDAAVTDLVIPVATISGAASLSRQIIERGDNVDQLIYADLVADYSAKVDVQTLVGTGSSGQVLGTIPTSGVIQATLFGAAATATTFYLKTAGAVANLTGQGAGIQPKYWVMHPRRWGWALAQVDTSGRPLVLATAQFNSLGVESAPGAYGGDNGLTVVGTLHGIPVVTDSNIPTNKGTDTVQDVVLLVDTTKLYLWEDGDGMPRQLEFEQTLGSQLTTNLIVYGYIAYSAGRYPGATGVVGGNDTGAGFGLTTPTF